MNEHTIPDADLLRAADSWLGARQLDAPTLHTLARERGLDFATAAAVPMAAALAPPWPADRARLEQPRPATSLNALIAIVPGAFYKEHAETGAAGSLIEESARRLGVPTAIVPLHSFGAVAANADLLADWLRRHQDRTIVLVTHSKGTTELRHVLARPDAAVLLRPIHAVIDVSGLFLGTPIVGWLRAHPIRRQLVRLLFWWRGHSFAALDDIDQDACPPWPGALDVAPWLDAIHLIGFPLERHLTTPLIQRGYRRLAPLGPNDGVVLLESVFALPGRIYPVWGADHYLRPAGCDPGQLMTTVIGYLAEQACAGVRR